MGAMWRLVPRKTKDLLMAIRTAVRRYYVAWLLGVRGCCMTPERCFLFFPWHFLLFTNRKSSFMAVAHIATEAAAMNKSNTESTPAIRRNLPKLRASRNCSGFWSHFGTKASVDDLEDAMDGKALWRHRVVLRSFPTACRLASLK